ncbi:MULTISPECIES: glutaredoxin family protein [Halomonadaceae]|uniref:Glutaredoxin-like domain n=1 Tax=Vreelandella subterranea TaxID=416874 RepID=A0A1H9RJC8_9GAMM|nr:MULTISPECIES: glutaredoxin family protein [Halomonas]MCO7246658.1 glutaredoxin family protein [Halomonas sp. Mc5H-6]SER72727.1 Glutaredoxin-like domain [Halomonas subterranea]
MIRLTLYTTQGCHLCAELEARVAALTRQPIAWQRVEVADDETLLARYGERIPVLADDAGNELEGGYALESLCDWLRARGWLDEAALSDLMSPAEVTAPKGGYQRNGRRFLG